MSKKVRFNKEAQQSLLEGFKITAEAINGTIGPKGRNVLFQGPFSYEITNDGATIADKIEFSDKQKDAGAWILRNVSAKQNDDVGDGTTTVSVLTQALIEECLKRPENPMEIRNSLNEAALSVLEKLASQSVKITKDDVEKVAYISAEDKTISKLISEIINKLGEKAVIYVEDSKTFETHYDIVDGYECKNGFMSPNFINDKKNGKAVLENVHVLCTEKKIANLVDIAPIFEQFKKNGINQCVIVAEDIDDSMLGMFVLNNLGVVGPNGQFSQFKSIVIRAGGETLQDIEGVTGAKRVSDTTGITFKNLQLEHLGQAKKVVSDAHKTLFLVDGEVSKNFADVVEASTKDENNQYIQEKNRVRLAKLRGGVATLRIAAPTDTERVYLRRKADDAVKATQAALEEGVVVGGGMALWKLAQGLEDKTIGGQILKKAMIAPFRKIVENAGKDYAEIVRNMPENQGYDAKEDKFVDLIEAGILDPVKVTRCALENACSTAGVFITTFAVITDKEEKNVK